MIYRESDPVSNIFLVKSGEVQIFKSGQTEPDKKSEKSYLMSRDVGDRSPYRLPIAKLTANQFFGETEIIERIEQRV